MRIIMEVKDVRQWTIISWWKISSEPTPYHLAICKFLYSGVMLKKVFVTHSLACRMCLLVEWEALESARISPTVGDLLSLEQNVFFFGGLDDRDSANQEATCSTATFLFNWAVKFSSNFTLNRFFRILGKVQSRLHNQLSFLTLQSPLFSSSEAQSTQEG